MEQEDGGAVLKGADDLTHGQADARAACDSPLQNPPHSCPPRAP